MRYIVLIFILALIPLISFSQTIDVSVQGISDGVKNSKQRDRDEAILDAKLKAIERAGVSIEAVTTMENFELKKDWVESRAKALILPGFQIIDIGYGADGLYHVVLTGKVSPTGEGSGDSEGDKKLRMAKLLLEKDKSRALEMMKEVVDNYGDCSSADDALYYLTVLSPYNEKTTNDNLIKLKAYYPNSQFIPQVEKFIDQEEQKIEEEKRKKEEEEKRPEEYRKAKPTIESMKFVTIPSGSFMMGYNDGEGDERPVHTVYIKSFKMMTTEVTQAQWVAVMGNNPSFFKGDDLPVEQVSWNDTQEFIKKLNQLDPGKGYRLPTEAEWEYACRAGTTSKYHSGNSDSDLGRAGWYSGNSGSKTHPVVQKTPNGWGMYDMHGNVCEWCEDWYHDSYLGAPTDGSAWVSPAGEYRVLRGGAWYCNQDYCRSAARGRNNQADRHDNNVLKFFSGSYGFRLARSL